MSARMRLQLAATLAAAAVLAAQARADDGGSGTFSATGSSYQVTLVNTGTSAWQYFTLTAPTGVTFVGGATQGEITARCTAGMPDALPNEIECGPVNVAAGARVGVAVTVTGTASCGSALHLAVSATGTPPFSPATDVAPAVSCSAAQAAEPANACSSAVAEAAAAATVAELEAEEQALAVDWAGAATALVHAKRAVAARSGSAAALRAIGSARVSVARLEALSAAVSGQLTTATTTLEAEKAATSCKPTAATTCASLTAAGRSRLSVFNEAARDIGSSRIAAASSGLARALTRSSPPVLKQAATQVRAGAAQLARFLGKKPAAARC